MIFAFPERFLRSSTVLYIVFTIIISSFFSIQSAYSQIVINELMVAPEGDIITNSFFTECSPSEGSARQTFEWIELYNTSPCDTVDISCFVIASNTGNTPNLCSGDSKDGLNAGSFTFPTGTKIFPLSFITVGGVEGGKKSTFDLKNYKSKGFVCSGKRWFLNNNGGWLGLYDPNGNPINAVYWGGNGDNSNVIFEKDLYNNDVTTNCTCKGTGNVVNLPSARTMFNQNKIEYVGNISPSMSQENLAQFYRLPDGGVWIDVFDRKATPNKCNDACIKQGNLVSVNPKKLTVCPGSNFMLTANPDQGVDPLKLKYFWTSDPPGHQSSNQSFALSLTQSTNFFLKTIRGSCIDYDTVIVQVFNVPSSAFDIFPKRICIGDTATITYLGTPLSGAIYKWKFDGGNAIPGTGIGPHKVTWKTKGTKTIGISVENKDCVSDFEFKAIDVFEKPVAKFMVEPSNDLCIGNAATITFTGNAGNSATFDWSFDGGNATPGIGKGPHKVTWNVSGKKNIFLSVSENQCKSTPFEEVINISNPPNAEFLLNPDPVCLNEETIVKLINDPGASAKITWNFDGGTFTSEPDKSQKVKWNTSGSKNISVKVEVPGCPERSSKKTVVVHDAPVINISSSTTEICEGEEIIVKIQTSATDAQFTWNYDGGNSSSGGGNNDQTIKWNSPGKKKVLLTATKDNCTVSSELIIQVKAKPIADFSLFSNSPCIKDETIVTFTGSAGDNAEYIWDFSGAEAVPGIGKGPHSLKWATEGSKSISLKIIENGCTSDIKTQTQLLLYTPKPNFQLSKNKICTGEPITLTFSGEAKNGEIFSWNFDGAVANTGIGAGPHTLKWDTPGRKIIKLSMNFSSCFTDTFTTEVIVSPIPIPDFKIEPSVICAGQKATITFLGTAAENAIYNWNFSGGIVSPGANLAGPHTITWNNEGKYTIALQIDDQGCLSNTISRDINVNFAPSPKFTISADTICSGDIINVNYVGSGTSEAKLNWNFDGGEVIENINDRNLKIRFSNNLEEPIAKTITLMTNEKGCTAGPENKEIQIFSFPQAAFTINPNPVCENSEVIITFTGKAMKDANFLWDFNGGEIIENGIGRGPHKIRWVNFSGEKELSLRINNNLCESVNYKQKIKVKKKPIADFEIFPDEICQNDKVKINFTGIAGPNARFEWSFINGNKKSDFTREPDSVAFYSEDPKNISLKIIENDCESEVKYKNIKIIPLPFAEFKVSRNKICTGDTVQLNFTGTASIDAKLTWNMDGGSIVSGSDIRNPIIEWDKPGEKSITLLVTENACISLPEMRKISVIEQPVAMFDISASTICVGDPLTITFKGKAPGNTRFLWDFSGAHASNITSKQEGPYKLTFSSVGKKIISLQLINDICTTEVKTLEVLVVKPSADFSIKSPVCVSQWTELKLKQAPPPGSELIWIFDNAKAEKIDSLTYRLNWNTSGSKRVSLRIVVESCTTQSIIRNAVILDRPQIYFTVNPDSGRAPLKVKFNTAFIPSDYRFEWDFGDGNEEKIIANPEYEYGTHGTFYPTLRVINPAGCETKLIDTIQVTPRQVFIPNAFSPNEDNQNEFFELFNLNGVERFKLEIYNRWGQKVFETSSLEHWWDGKFSGTPAQEGAYVYKLLVTEKDNTSYNLTGTVTLIR